MRTFWGHPIIHEKKTDYVLFKDYLEVSNRIIAALEDLENIKDKIDKNDKINRIDKLILMTTYNHIIGTLNGTIAINKKDGTVYVEYSKHFEEDYLKEVARVIKEGDFGNDK